MLYNVVQVAKRLPRMLELRIDFSDDKVLRSRGSYRNYVDAVLRGIHRPVSNTTMTQTQWQMTIIARICYLFYAVNESFTLKDAFYLVERKYYTQK